jgi:hypothetical protein
LKSIDVAISVTNLSKGIRTDCFYGENYVNKTLKDKFAPQLLKMLNSCEIPEYMSERKLICLSKTATAYPK